MSTTTASDLSGPAGSPDLRAALAGVVDDAAIFPPGNASVPAALRGHREHREAWYADMVGPFLCADTRLVELGSAMDEAAHASREPLQVSVTIAGGAGSVEPALTWVGRDERLVLRGVEVALRDEEDLAHNAARMTTVLAGALADDVSAYVEVPRLHGTDIPTSWTAALDEVAAAGHQAKFRTGGLDHDAFPTAAELATVLEAFLDRETSFKCTAGLHHAVRHTAQDTGFEHHGFLNVLLATRALLDGASATDAAELLEVRDRADVADRVRELGPTGVAGTRRWFTSFGTCSIIEPVDDLVDLDLISKG